MKIKICILLGLRSFWADAQEPLPSDTVRNLNEIVITGSFTPQTARQSVYQIRSITPEIIRQRGASRIQDLLTTETNIRFNQDLATGNSNMSMQGLAGQNVKILLDGVPMVGRQGTNNEINLNQIDLNTVQRIEIIEGPMSVIYGADALAGVINIITKKAIEGKADLALKIQEETIHTSYGWPAGVHQYSLSGGISKGPTSFKANGAYNGFGGFRGSAVGRDYQWHPKTQSMAGAVIGYERTRWNTHYRVDYMNEDIFNPGVPTSYLSNDQNYITNRWMHQWQSDITVSSKIKLYSSLAYTHFGRRILATTYNDESNDRRLSIAPGSQDTTVFNGLSARILLPIKFNSTFTLLPGIDINAENGRGGRISSGNHGIQDYSFILSGDIKINEHIALKPGLRIIYNSVYDAPPAIPSLNAKWDIAPNQTIKLAYGRGFRAPSIRELFFSFFDSNHAVIGNKDLKAELSNSYSASYNWKISEKENNHLDLTINAFYNDVHNLINFGQSPGNAQEVTYINIDRYKTKGLGSSLQSKAKNLTLGIAFSYTGRYNRFNEEDKNTVPFVWSPEGSISALYHFKKSDITLGLFQKYTGKTPYFESRLVNGVQSIIQSIYQDYSWTDINLNKNINPKLSIATGIRNLFNVIQINSNSSTPNGVHTAGNSQAIGYGRSVYITINYNIIK